MPDPTSAYPLYDPRFEHDACGVGFVADAGGGRGRRVLPLALAGLAILGHRGAFAADGESSDGAGVALPLEPALLAPARSRASRGRPGVVMLFLPRRRTGARTRARALVEAALDRGGSAGRRVARRARRSGCARPRGRAQSMPVVAQAIVDRAGRVCRMRRFERRLLLARRRMELRRGRRRRPRRASRSPSASSRTVVYKGLVAGDRLADLLPRPGRADLPLSHAVFHQRYATNTHPRWRLAQPFRLDRPQRRDQHGARQPRAGARPGGRSLGVPARPASASPQLGPLLSPRRLRLALARRGARPARRGRLAARCGAAAGDPRGAGAAATEPSRAGRRFRRRTRRPPRPVGRPGGARLQRRPARRRHARPQRPAARCLSPSPTTGSWRSRPRPARCPSRRPRRRRLGRARARRDAASSTRGAGRILERRRGEDRDPPPILAAGRTDGRRSPTDLDRRRTRMPGPTSAHRAGAAPRGRARRRAAAARHQDDGARGQEPLWSMGDDTPDAGAGHGSIGRSTDHLRQSFAQVTNPPIDPERERIVMDLAVELGRRAAAARRHPDRAHGRSVSVAVRRRSRRARAVGSDRRPRALGARRDLGGRRARPASAPRSTGWPRRRCSPSTPARSSCWCSPTGRCRARPTADPVASSPSARSTRR